MKNRNISQEVETKGSRKTIITRIAARRWAVAKGWASEVVIKNVEYVASRTTARVYAKDWLNDQN